MQSIRAFKGLLVFTFFYLVFLPGLCFGTSLALPDPSLGQYDAGAGPGPSSPAQDLDIPPDPQLDQAVRLANAGQLKQSLDRVKGVLKHNPKSTPALELQGAILVLQGRMDEGLKALQEAVRLNPQQSTALTKIGDIYLAQGKFQEARTQFLKALEANPDYARAHQRLGLIFEKQGKIPAAIEHFEKGLKGTPVTYGGIKVNLARLYNLTHQFNKTINLLANKIPPGDRGFLLHILLATAYLGQKQSELERAEFDRALKLTTPNPARAYLALGIACREAGLNEDSRLALKQAIQLQPKQALVHWELGKTLASLNEPEAALAQMRQATQLAPNNRVLKKDLAALLLEQKKFPEAITIYQEVLRMPGAGPEDYDALVSAYQIAGQYDRAKKLALERVKRYPQDPFSYYRLGLFYGFLKKYDQAVIQFDKGLQIAPHNLSLLQALTLAYQRQGELKQAIETNKKLVHLDPENIAHQFSLAFLYKKSGDPKTAITIYREILAQHADEIAAMNNLAQLLVDAGNLPEAQQLAEKAAALAPENGHVLDTLGWIWHKNHDTQKALSLLGKAASLLPDNPDVLYHFAVVLNQQGQKPEARQYLQKALEISKDFSEAEQAEKLLQNLPVTTKN